MFLLFISLYKSVSTPTVLCKVLGVDGRVYSIFLSI